jgi:hypothetical protein
LNSPDVATVAYLTSPREQRLDRTLRWFIYSVVFGGFPIFALVLARGSEESVGHVLGQGDLLMLGAVLSAAAIGEALGVEHVRRIIRNLLVGACLLTLTASSLIFAMALDERTAEGGRGVGLAQSLIFFVLNAIAAGATMWVTGEPDPPVTAESPGQLS